ncbi:hypothetical protein VTJ83DRAFT_6907 [Remersonia thermophila]|uniref:ATP-dependent RNA helicase n=1 Tax=Remersonia thermophila TaxID=72144 RepID=A0ABR4D608_9PEZI
MYNRYIPPPKPKEALSSAAAPASTPSSRYAPKNAPPPPPPPPPPPAPAQPQRIVFNDDNLPPVDYSERQRAIDEELTGTAEKKTKQSRSKKDKNEAADNGERPRSPQPRGSRPLVSRKRKSPEPEADPSAAPEEEQEARNGNDADATSGPALEAQGSESSPKKPKREKKKKKKKQDADGDTTMVDADEDDDMRRRHKSVFEKVQRSLQLRPLIEETPSDREEDEPQVEHGLEPLPQPEPVVLDQAKVTYETLPPWLASPVRVASDTTKPFTELGLSPEASKVLESKGFKDAFAVQTAVLPLLLASPERQGDVVVAAPTGSGKTLSYVLPLVRDISRERVTRLRALIVLPTRDLVQQVQQACEACAAAFAVGGGKRVKIGMAMGNRVFKEEQMVILSEEQRYDPPGYERYLRRRDRVVGPEGSDDEDDDLNLERSPPLPDHIVTYASRVDILICTPGRLVEHITKTPGFTLDYVRWLIVDEADKLLAQDFQQWLDTVNEALAVERPGACEFPGSNTPGVRKVILSATMTRDLSLLNGLKLWRPTLVVVEGTQVGEQNLPATLQEFAVKVREPSLKPLYLVDLLRSKHMSVLNEDAATSAEGSGTSESESSSESESDSDADSSSSSSSSSDSSDSDSSDSDSSATSSRASQRPPTRPPTTGTKPTFPTSVLVFTKSNEAALRLSRLLSLLLPDLAPLIGTLTSSTKTARRLRALRAFSQGRLRILVASDLVSRGIDLLNLEHVVNYDVPMSETSYVHRVGRTARAGRKGCAWTLVEHAEARRFWREFAGEGKGAATSIRRAGKVQRVRISEGGEGEEFGEARVKEYEGALERLKREAAGEGRR